MPIQWAPTKHAFVTEGESLCEPEHADSCNINLMLRDAKRGLQVRGGKPVRYGYDDTTMDSVQYRLQKEKAEKSLKDFASKAELTEEQLQKIPKKIREKFGFKTKAKTNLEKTTINDEKTGVETSPQKEPAKDPKPL